MEYNLKQLKIMVLHRHDGVAMENWGCITIRPDIMHSTKEQDGSDAYVENIRVLVHEVCH